MDLTARQIYREVEYPTLICLSIYHWPLLMKSAKVQVRSANGCHHLHALHPWENQLNRSQKFCPALLASETRTSFRKPSFILRFTRLFRGNSGYSRDIF